MLFMNTTNPGTNAPIPQAFKLGISNHTFKDRILDNCIYVDKTQYIYDLITLDYNYFLSRPRRFGKSLLISTLKELFSGNKELFKNCWIYDKLDWQEYPIIHIDFLGIDFKKTGLERAIHDKLHSLAGQFNIRLSSESINDNFFELIETLSKTKKTVILVDEYDKPITDYIENVQEAQKNRDILKDFYSILKAQNHNIKFLLITGVSRFSRVSIFSDINHLTDITLHPRYSRMLGYTTGEIERYFALYITEWEKQTGKTRDTLFESLKEHYNGYSWDGENFVYNPFSILNFFDTFQFKNYWFASGSPTFLVNKLRNAAVDVSKYERLCVEDNFFEKFEINTINISVLLFQTGYLTIKGIENGKYILSYPNKEVKVSFLQYLLEGLSGKSQEVTTGVTEMIKRGETSKNGNQRKSK
jgi:hypothetical protein